MFPAPFRKDLPLSYSLDKGNIHGCLFEKNFLIGFIPQHPQAE